MAENPSAILLVGAGRMGSALLRGWIASPHNRLIHVIEPQPPAAVREYAAAGSITLCRALNRTALPQVKAIVLAMKPQAIKLETALLRDLGTLRAPLISIAAGIMIDFLSSHLGQDAPVIRAMPNTPGAIGRGITVLCAGPGIGAAQRELAETLTGALGETLWLEDESLLDAVTAVSASGPAYVFLLVEAFAAAAREQGMDERTAATLARHTVMGAGALLAADRRAPEELRRDVTSPGGTTEAALSVLMAPDGLRQLMSRAIAAATERGRSLGKG